MRPEAAGSRETRGRLCHCRGDDPGRPALPPGPESPIPAPWRPWMPPPGDAELTRTRSPCQPCGNQQTVGSKGAFGFQHPVRLYLPISKRQEYLQSSGEKVLASFPVQATIHFYNDESDSEEEQQEEEEQQQEEEEQQQEEEEQQQEEEEAHCNHHQCQEAEAWPIHPQCWETEGPGGKGRLGLASL